MSYIVSIPIVPGHKRPMTSGDCSRNKHRGCKTTMVEKIDRWYGIEMLLCLLPLPGTDVGCRSRNLLRQIEFEPKTEGPAESHVCTVTDEVTMSPGSPQRDTMRSAHLLSGKPHAHGEPHEDSTSFFCFSQRQLTVAVVRGLCRTPDGKHM